jgi:hypothetical protein
MNLFRTAGLAGLIVAAGLVRPARGEADVRIGLIGLDTSHVVLLTALLNDPAAKDHVAGGHVVCAYQGGSPDMDISRLRIDGFTAQLRDRYGVAIVGSIAELLARCDAVVIESVDGRVHLRQAREVFPSGKPVFMDKPLGNNLAEARAIVRLARATHTPLFSASPYRFTAGLTGLREAPIGPVRGAVTYGNGKNEPHMPDLFYEAIHPLEALFVLLGPGCQSVSCLRTAESDVLTGVWPGGRTGVVYALRDTQGVDAGAMIFGARGVRSNATFPQEGFRPLTQQIVTFFRTRRSPVPLEETLEILAVMTAANESHRRGGLPVALADLPP